MTENFWLAYAAIAATVALSLEFRRMRREGRLKVTVTLHDEVTHVPAEALFGVSVVNYSYFAIHVIRAGFLWRKPGQSWWPQSLSSPLLGEIGARGGRRVHYVEAEWWKHELKDVEFYGHSPVQEVHAWIELSTGLKIFSPAFQCSFSENNKPHIMIHRPRTPTLEAAFLRLLPRRVRYRVGGWIDEARRRP